MNLKNDEIVGIWFESNDDEKFHWMNHKWKN